MCAIKNHSSRCRINEALKLNPNHVQALALSGSAAFERRDYARAVAQWKKLVGLISQDSEMRGSIEKNVAKAEGLSHDSSSALGRPR